MGHRLSAIATRTGDDGSTGLGDGSRTGKDSARIASLGDVDELNSVLGLLRAEALPDDVDADLLAVQHDLFDMGAELCIPGHRTLDASRVAWLDERLGAYNAELGPLREFILPGGSRQAGLAHLARTVCRRAERAVVALSKADHGGVHGQDGGANAASSGADVSIPVRQYLNRLSDLMFVLARYLNRAQGVPDVLWERRRG